jgi:hypothetical protein
MVSYDHLRPFLWSGANLRWSWPSFSQRHRAWQDRLAATAPQATVDAAVLSDFDAILVDRYAFKDDAKQLVAAFEAAGATRQFEHTRYVILDLANAKHQLLSRLGQTAFARQREEWLEPVRLLWDSGFYEPEATPAGASFRWSSQRSRLVVFNDSQRSRKLRMDFDVVSQGVGTVEVDDGRRHWTIDSQSAPRHASLELLIAPATKTILSFRGNVQRVVAPADPRALYFNIQNFAYAELAKDARDSAAVADTREQPR